MNTTVFLNQNCNKKVVKTKNGFAVLKKNRFSKWVADSKFNFYSNFEYAKEQAKS